MTSASFASRLDEAFVASPYSLERIIDMLAQQDLHVSQATLSHWRLGRSVPKRRNSLAVVIALEEILDLPHQGLTSLLPSDIKKAIETPTPSSGTEPQPVTFTYDFLFNETNQNVDWSNDVQREVLEEKTIVAADFSSQTYTTTFLVRIPQVAKPCLHFRVGLDVTDVIPEKGYVELYNIKGATVGERKVYDNGRTTLTRLDLPPSCYPGQLHSVSFSYVTEFIEPFNNSLMQTFAWPFRFYVNHIEFEGKVPDSIEWVEETIHKKGNTTYTSISTRPVIPIGNTVQVCLEKPTASRSYFRWE